MSKPIATVENRAAISAADNRPEPILNGNDDLESQILALQSHRLPFGQKQVLNASAEVPITHWRIVRVRTCDPM